MSGTITQRRAGRQAAILDAALRVIRRDGIDGLRAQSLADEAGISIATPYHYFTSLDDVVCAVYAREQGTAQTRREVARAAAGPEPADQLHAVLTIDFEGRRQAVRAFWGTRLEYQRRAIFDERVRNLVRAGENAVIAQLEGILTEERKSAENPPSISVDLAARRLLSLSCGLGVLVLLDIIAPAEAIALLHGMLEERAHWRAPTGASFPGSPLAAPEPGDRATRILDATIAVIAQSGTTGVHFPVVAETAGVSPSLPRYYFRTKRALLDAAFARDLELSQRQMERSAAEVADPLERLQYTRVGASAGYLAALRPTLVLWSEYLRLAEHDPVARAAARLRLDGWADYGVHLGTALATAGYVRPERVLLAGSRCHVAINTGAGPLWLIGVLGDDEYPVVVNGAMDDALGLGA